jgi:hypothetical protein
MNVYVISPVQSSMSEFENRSGENDRRPEHLNGRSDDGGDAGEDAGEDGARPRDAGGDRRGRGGGGAGVALLTRGARARTGARQQCAASDRPTARGPMALTAEQTAQWHELGFLVFKGLAS